MNFSKSDQQGFAPIAIIAVVIISFALLGTGYVVYTKDQDKKATQSASKLQANNQVQSSGVNSSDVKNEKPATTITDPDKNKIIAILVKDCGADGEQKLSSIANDEQKFVIRGYFARVNVSCESGSYVAYLEKNDEGAWKILQKTQQAPDCKNFDNTAGVAKEIVTTCYDGTAMQERNIQ